MKKLFKAVRHNDLQTIINVLDKNPELINCIATPPPKKDEDQSLLQVANKVNSLTIAHYLIDKGIDVNYMEPYNGLPKTMCFRCPVLIDAVRFILAGGLNWQEKAEERMKLIVHLLEKGADPNKMDNRGRNAWDWAICAYCDAKGNIKDVEEGKLFAELAKEVFDILYRYNANILDIDRINNELKDFENYSLLLKNLILNRDDLYGVEPGNVEHWKKRNLPVISIIKPYYMRNNPYYENVK